MPQITTQPSNTLIPFHPVGSLDSLIFKLRSSGIEFKTVSGVYPSLILEIDGAAQSNGNQFTVFGQTYTVGAVSESTASSINLLSGTAEQHAERLRDALLANINIFPYISISLTESAPNWRVTVTWNEYVTFADVYSNGTLANPYTVVSEVLGTEPIFIEGFRIAWQLFLEDGVGGEAITSLRSAPPPVVNGSEQDTELNFAEIAAGQVATRRPFDIGTTVTEDTTFMAQIFIRYGAHVSADGQTDWGSFKKSNVVRVVNSAVDLGSSTTKFTPYFFNGDSDEGQVRFLSNRPTSWEVCKEGQYEWLWIILNVAQWYSLLGNNTLTNYIVKYTTFDEDGNESTSQTNIGSADGIFIIPCGPSNFPDSLEGKVKYTVQVLANVEKLGTPEQIEVSEVQTFYLTAPCNCSEPYREIYFLDPLGGFGTFPVFDVTRVEAEQQRLLHETLISDSDSVTQKRERNGLSTNSHKAWLRISFRVRLRYTKANFNYLKCLRSAALHHLLYSPDDSTEEFWKFVPDEGTMEIYRDGDYAYAEMTGRLHADLPVQKQPVLGR